MNEDATTHQEVLKRHDFYHYCAQRMLSFCDDEEDTKKKAKKDPSERLRREHCGVQLENYSYRNCVVCNLEKKWGKYSDGGLRKNVVRCSKCNVTAHSSVPRDEHARKIHGLEKFTGMSCFEILHSIDGMALWKRHDVGSKRACDPQPSHPLYKHLQSLHGVTKGWKRKASDGIAQLPHFSMEDNDMDDDIRAV